MGAGAENFQPQSHSTCRFGRSTKHVEAHMDPNSALVIRMSRYAIIAHAAKGLKDDKRVSEHAKAAKLPGIDTYMT